MTALGTAPVPVAVGGNGAVIAERYDRVLLIMINRPDVLNAANPDVYVGIGEALELADADDGVRAVILTGAGNRSFCAGADLKAQERGEFELLEPRVKAWGFAGFARHNISTPVISAVNGFALGGGTELVLQSDLAVTVEEASFGFPEVTRGAYPGAGGAFRLGRQIPHKIAMEMLLTASSITARRALELGLVNQVVSADQLLPAAFELADRIVVNAPVAVQAAKRVARGMADGRAVVEDDDWARSEREDVRILASEDLKEGLLAFAEKRPAVWVGR